MNEELTKALDDKFESLKNDIQEAREKGATKEEVQKLTDALKRQGDLYEDFQERLKAEKIETILDQYKDFLVENIDKINEVRKAGKGVITFTPKAVGPLSTSTGGDAETPDVNHNTNLGSWSLRNDNPLLSMCTVMSTRSANYSYTDLLPKEGGYGFVAEGGSKPQIDFTWTNRYAKPKKAAAHMVLSSEAEQDIEGLLTAAREYLQAKHDLFKVNGIYFGSGTGSEPEGATTLARLFVAGDMAAKIDSPKILDVINCCVTDIYTTENYEDEMEKMANVALMNPVDFLTEFVSAKDERGLLLYPQASLFNVVKIGGVTIKPWKKIPTGKIFVADMKKYNVINYIPFKITVGWINDQFITNQFTLVGESRFYAFTRQLDRNAFIYDDIETIKTAVTAA